MYSYEYYLRKYIYKYRIYRIYKLIKYDTLI